MASFQTPQPIPVIEDIDGKSLDDGYIFIGAANLDPVANPISVFFDEALTQPAPQPIRTRGGYPLNGANIARLYVGSVSYSILVRNKNSFEVMTVAEASGPVFAKDLANASDPAKGAALVGFDPDLTYPIGTVGAGITDVSADLINAHNHDAAAHPELSAFITAEADRAEDAADAAAASGNIYPDTTAGLAATAEGGYFSVPSPESTEYLILYREVGGVAVEIKRYPSAQAITNLFDATGYDESGWAEAHVDTANNIAYGVRPDGTFSIGVFDDVNAAIPGAQIASRHFEDVPDGSGYAVAISDSQDNLAFAVFADGRVIAGGAEVASKTGQDQLFDIVVGTTDIVCWGDSLTEGSGSTGGQTYPAQLATLLGVPILNEGFGGQQVAQITARQGGNAALASISGNLIPASGAVAVALNVNLLSYPTSSTLSIYGYLMGIFGTLTKDPSNNYTFTRSTAGSAVIMPANTPFIVSRSTRNSDNVNFDQGINLFWAGSNDVANPSLTTIPTQLRKCIDKLTATESRKFLILGPIANKVYTSATAEYQAMRVVNDEMKATWPRNFIDIQDILVEHYNPLDAQDVIDYGNRVVPTSLRVDNIHLNNTGYGIVAAAIKAQIDMKGWIA